MNSQITSAESGVIEVFHPQRDAEYKTLQQMVDEDAVEILENKKRIQSAKDLIKSLQDDTRTRTARRKRNIERKKIVLKSAFEMQMVDEQ